MGASLDVTDVTILLIQTGPPSDPQFILNFEVRIGNFAMKGGKC
jgi:hypothetical protein